VLDRRVLEESPFYYRVQSPVTFIEFDHHAGVFLTNPEPAKFHVHTIVPHAERQRLRLRSAAAALQDVAASPAEQEQQQQQARRRPRDGDGHHHHGHGPHRHDHHHGDGNHHHDHDDKMIFVSETALASPRHCWA
jgi:hypothetical protein